jgi:hypothetical protein
MFSSIVFFGSKYTCVWSSANAVSVELGPDATVAPGDSVQIKASFLKIREVPSISNTGELIATVQGPDDPLKPAVSIFGPSNVDPCSNVVLLAQASTARAATLTWKCLDNSQLNENIRLFTGSSLTLRPQDFPTRGISYSIIVVASNYLGASAQSSTFTLFAAAEASRRRHRQRGSDGQHL